LQNLRGVLILVSCP